MALGGGTMIGGPNRTQEMGVRGLWKDRRDVEHTKPQMSTLDTNDYLMLQCGGSQSGNHGPMGFSETFAKSARGQRYFHNDAKMLSAFFTM